MADDNRLISKSLAYSLTAVLLLFGVGELILFSIMSGGPPHYSPWALYFVYLSSFLIMPILFHLSTKYESFKLPAVVWFHLTMGILLLYFSEIFSPFTALWSLLILFASVHYGWRGFTASSVLLGVISIAYCLMFTADLRPNPLVYSVLAFMVVMLTIANSYLFMRIIRNAANKNQELQRAQQSEQLQINRQTTLLNSISDAVLTLNRYGKVTSQNAAAQAFFDTNESLIGKDIDKLLGLKDISGASVMTHTLIDETKSSLLRDDLLTGDGGDTRHLSVQLSRIRSTFDDNEEYGVVMILRDITKQKSLEEEKDEFISVASHELRTPVAIAEGSLSNLLVMAERNIDENKLRGAATMAHDQVLYLAKMVNDLSTLSRAERNIGEAPEDLDVTALLRDLFVKYSPEAEEKSLRFDLDAVSGMPKIRASRLYLEEILENFITNALKYTKEGSVTLGANIDDEKRIRFWVRDTGIGMSRSDIDHIFEKFYRSEDYRTRETGGTGLGLYVVSKLANKLDAKIDVDSRLNHGSTFSLILPAEAPELIPADGAAVMQTLAPASNPISVKA